MSKISIVYFSGTGGTRLCAQNLAKILTNGGADVNIGEIRAQAKVTLPIADKLILMYPVYFANAPLPVQEFVSNLSAANGKYAAVLSVSAAGEVVPNLACRVRIGRALTDKGYNVVYENMLLMPANCLKKPHELVAAALLHVLPRKLDAVAHDILIGKVQRSPVEWRSYLATQTGRVPQVLSGLFSLFFTCSASCNACGKCTKSCPRTNISLHKNQVKWGAYCAACMNCVYICPQQAIKMRFIHNKFTIADGYDIDKYAALSSTVKREELETIAQSYTHSSEVGIRKYLLE